MPEPTPEVWSALEAQRLDPPLDEEEEIEELCDACGSPSCYCDWLYERAAERARGWD